MALSSPKQILRSRTARLLFLLFLLWEVFEVFTIKRDISRNQISAKVAPDFHPGKIFIVSLPWNNEIILRTHWNAQVVDLVKALGPSNVYLSIYENGSYDNTKSALRLLDEELAATGVRRHMVLEENSHEDMIAGDDQSEGWVFTARGRKELRRIPYLSRLRNIAMKPLLDLAAEGEHFDRILFLNDVVFRVSPTLSVHEASRN